MHNGDDQPVDGQDGEEQRPATQPHGRQFVTGVLCGLAPAGITAFLASANNIGPFVPVVIAIYVGLLVAAIAFMVSARRRYVGYGLLTALVVLPVIAAVACLVIVSSLHH